MKIDISNHGISLKVGGFRKAFMYEELTGDLTIGGQVTDEKRIPPETIPFSEIETVLTENGIDLSKPEPYEQHIAFKEAKQQQAIEQAERERQEQEAFANSEEGKAYYAELKKQSNLDSVDILTDAEVMRILIEEKKSALGIETVKQNVRAKIEQGEKDVRKAIKEDIELPIGQRLDRWRNTFSVELYKLKIELENRGDLEAIESVISKQHRKVQIAWENTPTVRRKSDTVEMLSQIMKYTPEQLDEIFQNASNIQL